MLRFDTDKFDFWIVYETIKRFYPIGIEKDECGVYESYPGIKELQAIIVDEIHDGKRFKEKWVSFERQLEKETGKKVIGTTYGQAPCFSSVLILAEKGLDNLTRMKKLHVFVSLLGEYYTIIGADGNTVILDKSHYASTNYLVVSPEAVFAESFSSISSSIGNYFPGYRFLPFWICAQTIEGLSVTHTDARPATVFNALFNDELNLDTRAIIGDEYYRSEEWVKAGYIDSNDGWTAYAPTL